MKKPALIVLGLLAALSLTNCSRRQKMAGAEQVRKTADGGTILLTNGAKPEAATRHALSEMAAHCKSVFEIVETQKTGTGTMVSASATSFDGWGNAYTSGASSQVFGMALTYLCRTPKSTELNQSVAEFASRDLLGQVCTVDSNCLAYKCTRAVPGSDSGMCTLPNGTLPAWVKPAEPGK
jgi:hypothetical protein